MSGVALERAIVDGCKVTCRMANGQTIVDTFDNPELAAAYAQTLRQLSAMFHGTPQPACRKCGEHCNGAHGALA